MELGGLNPSTQVTKVTEELEIQPFRLQRSPSNPVHILSGK